MIRLGRIYKYHVRNESDTTRFWAKVNKTEQCWVWTGAVDQVGYGMFWFNGHSTRAHIFAFSLDNTKEIGHEHHHVCKNRRCVRAHPEHVVPKNVTLHRSEDKKKLFCVNGHLLCLSNLYFVGKRRFCKTCILLKQKEYYQRKKQSANL